MSNENLMISNDKINDFCEKYTEEFKKGEGKIIEKMIKYIGEGYEKDEVIAKVKQEIEEIHESCTAMSMALHTEIVTRFVKSLPEDIQEEISKYMR